ncbi:MAG: hypothetical protein ROM03_01935 [Mucispirillum sp.]|nr:hypothetical protein [Mucispirillum sp.]
MPLLTISDDKILLNGNNIPGLLSTVSVNTSIRFDDQDIDGKSSKKKVPLGWSDADITIQLELITDDEGSSCYEKLAELDSIFRSKDKNKVKVFDIDNRHLNARNVRRVVFSNLESSENNMEDIIYASLSFIEYEPAITKTETVQTKSTLSSTSDKIDKKVNPEPEPTLMIDVK